VNFSIQAVNFNNIEQTCELVDLIDCYAKDPMGQQQPLSEFAYKQLKLKLKTLPQAHSFICYENSNPIGMINCFENFSTFQAQSILNIHDIFLVKQFRGMGLSQKLLKRAEQLALQLECCKMTLEVLSHNTIAKNAYIQAGFKPSTHDSESTLFWQKQLAKQKKFKE
jgi:GNAT superfamily N-acetyltransferase